MIEPNRSGHIPRAHTQTQLELNFQQLQMLTGDDNEFMEEILGMIIEDTPGSVEAMYELLERGDKLALSQKAHKFKSTVSILENQELIGVIKALEARADAQATDAELTELLHTLDSMCRGLMEQLPQKLRSLRLTN